MTKNELTEALIGLSVEDALELAERKGHTFVRYYPSGSTIGSDHDDERLSLEYNENSLVIVWAYFG